jgi:hypothetical protein
MKINYVFKSEKHFYGGNQENTVGKRCTTRNTYFTKSRDEG